MPRVSIITPCYNCESFIEQTIQSIQFQDFTDWEHIVVNDGSDDRSQAIVTALANSSKSLTLINQVNAGVARSRNVGYFNASPNSEYLLFLDGDDFLAPNMLSVMVDYLDRHPDLGFVYCDRTYTNSEGIPIETPRFLRYAPSRWGIQVIAPDQPETPFSAVFNLAPVIPSVSLIRRSVYAQTNGWDEEFGQHYEDTNLFLNLAIRSKVHYLDQSLVYYRRHGNQSTATDANFTKQENKLYHLWTTRRDLTEEQHKLIRDAWNFRNGKLAACLGIEAGNRILKEGHISTAIRFYGGALRRYIASFWYDIILS
jgi:glycosyltransferase involved in cell wall biosynthesis